ncbi:MAG: hypothetical protein FI717_00520 [SAR202 cluster bacterium]|nr:hypothetical protein [SAR202 cluster bacterium]
MLGSAKINTVVRKSRDIQEEIQARAGELPQVPDPAGFLHHALFLLILVAGALVLVAAFGEWEGFIDRLGDS